MSAWGTTNHNKYAAPPRPPTRSMSGDSFSTTPRKPLVSFARSASLAATVTTPTRGLPTPPPLPPLPKEIRHRSPSLSHSQQNFSPFAYSPIPQSINTANDAPRPYTATSDFPQLPSLPPSTPTRYKLFNLGLKKSGTRSPPPPAVPPRPITSQGAQSYSSASLSSPAREKLPPLPARPDVLDISFANSSELSPWSAVSPHKASCSPSLPPTSPIILASPRTNTNRYGFLNYLSSNRPHTAAPSQSYSQSQRPYQSIDPVEFTKPLGPPLPPLPSSMPSPNDTPPLPPPPPPPPPQMDSDLEHALHLSRTESSHKTKVQQREDEELAKAIAESLALSKQSSPQDAGFSINVVKSPSDSLGIETNYSHVASPSTPGSLKIPNAGDRSYLDLTSPFEKEAPTPSSLFLDMDDPVNKSPEDELAMHLQQEETRQMAVDILDREELARRDAQMSKQLHEKEKEESLSELDKRAAEQKASIERSISKLREAQEKRDAELARMMDEWEQGGAPSSESIGPHSPMTPPPPQSPFRLMTKSLPSNNGQTSPAGVMLNDETRLSLPPKALFTTPSPPSLPPGSGLDSNSHKSASTASPTSTSQPSDGSSVSRSHSASSTIGKDSTSSQSHTTNLQQPSRGWSREPSPGPTSVSANSGNHVLQDSRTYNINDEEAEEEIADLRGFAYGFSQPIIPASPPQASLACAPFPSIVNLSPTPYPSFHIMAPSWRHLLRLLAGQETRIQAHIDVIATRKEEQKLRVVIQFVKLTYTANTWRTIIHLSLDESFPPTVPASATTRFTNGDTTVLPYSYAISDHGRYMMGPNMQIYAVPLSSTSPFPILPITFSNLALYLQSVMKDSRARKVRHDSFRRLAKIVQSCYPEEVMPSIQEERKPSRGVGKLFKRVVGRVNNNNRGDGTGNEDVFDMITPFRLDQYATPTPSPASTSASASTTFNSQSP